jgi:glucan 1,3-beta-glucosidase
VNAFGFWQGQDISNATHQYFDDIMQAYQHINSIAPGNKIELWTGETGWPSDGTYLLRLHFTFINPPIL